MNKHNKYIWLVSIALILGVVGYMVWRNVPARNSQTHCAKVRFYQDSMHPWVKSGQPGKCTICGMDLTPICEGAKELDGGDNIVALGSNSITVLNVQTEEVKRRPLNRTLRVAGTLEANETGKIIVAAPAPARIETLNVAYTGVEVEKGQTLIALFSPELIQKRGYFRAGASNSLSPSPGDLYSGSLVAPLSGTVVERPVSVGQYVEEGEKLLTIADASVLWFRFDVYESQLTWIAPGQSVDVTVAAVPGRKFPAVISFVEPTLDDAARTVKVRADIENPVVTVNNNAHRLLKFGMYAEGIVRTEIPDALAVPRTAILFPGGSAYAYVDKGGGAYERRRVTLGRQGDELWEVLRGLEEGDRVVIAGNVLMDAQAQFNRGNKSDDANAIEPTAEVLPQSTLKQDQAPMTADVAASIRRSPVTQSVSNKMLSYFEMKRARMAFKDQMWNKRNALIAEARGEKSAGTPASDPPGQTPESMTAKTSGNAVQDYREGDKARRTISAEMREVRNAAIAGAHGATTADAVPVATGRRQALQSLVAEADGVSRALAADDFVRFNESLARLAAILPQAQKELTASNGWEDLIRRLALACKVPPAKDLAEARKQFLPFSITMVELAGRLRKEDPAFAGLKIYRCPMAPPPGVWIQAQGPLLNPYYGSEMLKCGEEVKP